MRTIARTIAMVPIVPAVLALSAPLALAPAPAPAQNLIDADALAGYPTAAREDYIFGCMEANQRKPEMLPRCECSIDHIAGALPYDKYVGAETVLSLRQTGGERMAVFRTTQLANELVADLRRTQAEAEILCFRQ